MVRGNLPERGDDGGAAGRDESVEAIFVRTRLPLHFIQRTGTRINQLISPFWDDRPRSHRAVTLGLIAVDGAVGLRMHRDPRLNLNWRLPLDAAEIALAAALAVRDDYDEASVPAVPGCPLAVEAGARLGWKGFIVPAVNLAVGTTVRRVRGHKPRTGALAWQVAATVGGVGLAAYGRRRRRAELERHRREHSALTDRARVEGRHDVVMRDSVVDEIQRATTLLDLSGPTRRSTNMAGAWKAEVAEHSRASFVYLGDELLRWQAATNAERADLSRLVRFELEPAAASIILGDDQVVELRRSLVELELTGRVPVGVTERRLEVVVTIADRTVRLRAAQPVPRTSFDPIPGAFCWSALWLMVAGASSREHVPAWAAFGPASLALGAAGVSHRMAVRHGGRAPRPLVVGASAVLTVGGAALQTATMRNTHGHGAISRYPFSLALRGFMLVALLAWRDLSLLGRAGTTAAAAATIGVGWQLSPDPRSGRELVAELMWPLQSVTLGGRLVESIDSDAARLATEIRDDDARQIDEARMAGRVSALRFADRCLREAEETFASIDDRDDDILAEAGRRLRSCREDVDRALDAALVEWSFAEPLAVKG